MKRLLVLLFILSVLLTAVGCSELEVENSSDPVEINLPQDNTVNGYRLESKETKNPSDKTVNADNVTVEPETNDTANQTENSQIKYCANIKSRYFHKSDCSSVKNMQQENKFYLSDRTQLIEDGYTPCKQCKP